MPDFTVKKKSTTTLEKKCWTIPLKVGDGYFKKGLFDNTAAGFTLQGTTCAFLLMDKLEQESPTQ